MLRRSLLFTVLATAPAHATTAETITISITWITWGVGLLCGVAIMLLTSLDWHRLPELSRQWLWLLRQNAGWASLGLASIAVLAFY